MIPTWEEIKYCVLCESSSRADIKVTPGGIYYTYPGRLLDDIIRVGYTANDAEAILTDAIKSGHLAETVYRGQDIIEICRRPGAVP